MINKTNILSMYLGNLLRGIEGHKGYASMQVLGGCVIDEAAQKATTASRFLGNVPVNFQFNNILLTCRSNTKPASATKKYHKELHKRAEAFKVSLEGVARRKKWDNQHQISVEKAQFIANRIVNDLPKKLKEGEASTLKAVADLDEALYSGAKLDEKTMKKVFQMIKSKGYINNDALHLQTEDYNNTSVRTRYLIGQFINCPGLGKIKMMSERYFNK